MAADQEHTDLQSKYKASVHDQLVKAGAMASKASAVVAAAAARGELSAWDHLLHIPPGPFSAALATISAAEPTDVQAIAAAQIGLLDGYHQVVLNQSKRSFTWALIGAGAGLAFFLTGAGFAIWTGNAVTSLIPIISGAVVEIVAGIVFYLYGRTTLQLGEFHRRLSALQLYLVANSICERLQMEARDKARVDLIREIARDASKPTKANGPFEGLRKSRTRSQSVQH